VLGLHGSSTTSRDSSTGNYLISVLQSNEGAVKCTSACIRAYAQLLHCHVRDNTGAAQRRAQQEAAAAAASAGEQP
jgi:IS1 family transposase